MKIELFKWYYYNGDEDSEANYIMFMKHIIEWPVSKEYTTTEYDAYTLIKLDNSMSNIKFSFNRSSAYNLIWINNKLTNGSLTLVSTISNYETIEKLFN